MRPLKIIGTLAVVQLLAGCSPPSIACSTDSAKTLVAWLARNQLQAADRSTKWRNASVAMSDIKTLDQRETQTACSAVVSFTLAPEDAAGKSLTSLDRVVRYNLSRTADNRLYGEVLAYD